MLSRSVRAIPVQSGVNLEENRETQKKNVDDEEMMYAMYMKLLEQEPRNVEALKGAVNVKMKKGNTKEAVKFVESLIKIEPKQVEWRLLEALCHEMMGNLTKAKRLFNEILKKRPLLLRALHGLAMVMHKNREGDAVFDMLNQALELALRERRVTEERNIKILIAQMHLVKGNLDEALKKYRELIDENPRDFRPYLCQGIIYSLQERRRKLMNSLRFTRILFQKNSHKEDSLKMLYWQQKQNHENSWRKSLTRNFHIRNDRLKPCFGFMDFG
ncbi:protein SLOW GREEN 1 chloroplastic [Bienertia sinuspersici]